MGLIATVQSFMRTSRNGAALSEAKVDPGGGALSVTEHFGAPGDDSHPLDGDYLVVIPTTGSGRGAAIGYIDPKNQGVTAKGERRLYSRNADGEVKSVIWLKSDGSVTVSNDNGSFTLGSDGNVSATGSISAPSIIVDGKELKDHTHPYSWTGVPGSGNTGGNS